MTHGKEVRPPKWSDVINLYNDGKYSVIWGRCENNAMRTLGVRWNSYGESRVSPVSSGHPVWHVEPDFLAKGILSALLERIYTIPDINGNGDNILTAMSELLERFEPNGIHLAIVLYAAGNRGKTTTLKMLIDLLKEDIAQQTQGNGEKGALAFKSYELVEETPYWENAADVLFCCKYSGMTIGVATGGDDEEAQKIAFGFFSKYNCDIVFCATRSRSDSYSWRAFESRTSAHNVRVKCIRKRETDVELDQEAVNLAQAKELKSLIMKG